jgi:hypothetical protein
MTIEEFLMFKFSSQNLENRVEFQRVVLLRVLLGQKGDIS